MVNNPQMPPTPLLTGQFVEPGALRWAFFIFVAAAIIPSGSALVWAEDPGQIQWIDVGPSEDTGSKGLGHRILFTPDQRNILFSNNTITFDNAYLWHVEEGRFTEYAAMPMRSVEQLRSRPFLKPPHPKRKAIVSIPDNLAKLNQRSNLDAILDDGFSLSTQGPNGTTYYYFADFNLQRKRGRELSLGRGMAETHSWSRLIHSTNDPTARNPRIIYSVINLRTLQAATIASATNDRPSSMKVGHNQNTAAMFFSRGIHFHSMGPGKQVVTKPFAFPMGQFLRFDYSTFVHGDKYFLMVLYDNELKNKAFWLMDVATAEVIQRLPIPQGASFRDPYKDVLVNESGSRLFVRRGKNQVSLYDVTDAGLKLSGDETSDPNLAELAQSVAWGSSADGTHLAFIRAFGDGSPTQVGLLSLAP